MVSAPPKPRPPTTLPILRVRVHASGYWNNNEWTRATHVCCPPPDKNGVCPSENKHCHSAEADVVEYMATNASEYESSVIKAIVLYADGRMAAVDLARLEVMKDEERQRAAGRQPAVGA